MAPWFLSAKVFVYPGYIGLSIMHAMGYGLPVITHHNMSNQSPEVSALRDGENGMFCQEHDSKDLSDRMIELLNNDGLRSRMSDRALQTATEEFTMGEMVRRFVVAARSASARAKQRART